ncbi:MAG: hypothetical protein GY696_10505 [Gammaproteobacteria bacterium]|nr:hypothetical protein [Gammaproteobacteria bacterium]
MRHPKASGRGTQSPQDEAPKALRTRFPTHQGRRRGLGQDRLPRCQQQYLDAIADAVKPDLPGVSSSSRKPTRPSQSLQQRTSPSAIHRSLHRLLEIKLERGHDVYSSLSEK